MLHTRKVYQPAVMNMYNDEVLLIHGRYWTRKLKAICRQQLMWHVVCDHLPLHAYLMPQRSHVFVPCTQLVHLRYTFFRSCIREINCGVSKNKLLIKLVRYFRVLYFRTRVHIFSNWKRNTGCLQLKALILSYYRKVIEI
jgi:hypothetical protein